ncbi:MAG: signal recognition particle-docking protein FtsY [Clostridiales bacterium]|nr:MAG: signal recognition particle-docking protein FtsY [Clostridiales bacterium]
MFKWFKNKFSTEKNKEDLKENIETLDKNLEIDEVDSEELKVNEEDLIENTEELNLVDETVMESKEELNLADETVVESKEELNLADETVVESKDELNLAKETVDKPKKGFFASLFSGLEKTRKNIGNKIDNLINNYDEIDDDLFEELEEILIMADISYESVMKLVETLKEELVLRKIKQPSKIKEVLADVMVDFISDDSDLLESKTPVVILVIGVNGAGKTTTIGKMASRFANDGKKVMVAAADTFRAAAIDQLKVWADRANVSFISHEEGSDPSAVIFDGLKSAKARKMDILICDTAGRLHNKVNLMNELKKMHGVIDREYPEANKEVLLVLDATTGQNAISQAKLFKEVADITGLVVTKLDGTAKGGFVFSIKDELEIPVKLIGVGEKIEDLRNFDAREFVSAIVENNIEQES